MSIQHIPTLLSIVRASIVAVFVAICIILSTDGIGGQTIDQIHGDMFATTTPLLLGSSVAGNIDAGEGLDVYELDLSGSQELTDVWIFTTGDLNSLGELFNRNGELIASNNDLTTGWERNFHLRAILTSGVYYLTVGSFREAAGAYTLHARTAMPAGATMETATPLNLNNPTTGTIVGSGDEDYFRLDFTEATNLILNAVSGNSATIDSTVLDNSGKEISVNVFPVPRLVHPSGDRSGFQIEDYFSSGTYFIRVTSPYDVTPQPVPYTIHALEDTDYPEFIEDCEAQTRSLNEPLISDSLYACQWHLNIREDVDINVESVWAEGIKGENVNIAVVDDGMNYTHKDLRSNVNASLNHDYTGNADIHHPSSTMARTLLASSPHVTTISACAAWPQEQISMATTTYQVKQRARTSGRHGT